MRKDSTSSNPRQLLIDSTQLGNTCKIAEIEYNAFILNKKTFFEVTC